MKQKAAPAGYDSDIKGHSVVITKAVSTELAEATNTYVTTTTYGITIDDKSAIDIANTKRSRDERVDGEVTVIAKDQDGAALSGLTFGLYPSRECADSELAVTFQLCKVLSEKECSTYLFNSELQKIYQTQALNEIYSYMQTFRKYMNENFCIIDRKSVV